MVNNIYYNSLDKGLYFWHKPTSRGWCLMGQDEFRMTHRAPSTSKLWFRREPPGNPIKDLRLTLKLFKILVGNYTNE